MDIWYTENHTDNVRLSIRIDRQLASVQSEFQRIDVFDSVEFGRIMTLDGLLMVTEKDEYIYHEMITHIPMATNPSIKKVLVIVPATAARYGNSAATPPLNRSTWWRSTNW